STRWSTSPSRCGSWSGSCAIFRSRSRRPALIDGCSRLRALIRVVIPIIAPGLAVVALFAFIATWNEFLFAIVLTGIETKTIMVLVTSFTSGGTDTFYGEASASVVLGVLPAFAVAFFLQRYLVKGLALGGTKG